MIKLLALFLAMLCGCGYTTRGLIQTEKNIVIAPVINNISVSDEGRRYSNFTSYPILLEKRLTNAIADKFNIDGHIKVTTNQANALGLSCAINEYKRETTRYDNADNVEEQRLRLHVQMKLTNPKGEIIREKKVVGETSYFLTGANSMTETTAQGKLVDDTARRIMEAVVEEW